MSRAASRTAWATSCWRSSEVLEDTAADWEAGMRVTETIRYAPVPTLAEPWARATLAALATPRARA